MPNCFEQSGYGSCIAFAGVTLDHWRAEAPKRVGMMFQQLNLSAHFTVLENVLPAPHPQSERCRAFPGKILER